MNADVIWSKIVIGIRMLINIWVLYIVFFRKKQHSIVFWKRTFIIKAALSVTMNMYLLFGDGFEKLIDRDSIFWGPFILYEIVL